MPGRRLTPLAARLDSLLPDDGYPRKYPWRKLYFAVAAATDAVMVALAFVASYLFTFHVLERRPEGSLYPAAF